MQPLTNASGEFMRHWGIITLDFESQEQIWGHHPGKNSDEMMLAEAVKVRASRRLAHAAGGCSAC